MRLRGFVAAVLARAFILGAASVALACGDDQGSEPGDQVVEPQPPPDIAGTWLGSIATGLIPLRIVFNIETAGDDAWTGSADRPDQAAFGIPISEITVGKRGVVTVAIDSADLVFKGELSEDGLAWTGTVTQAGRKTPLVLEKQPGPLDYTRPQDPVPPFPYESADVTFESDEEGVTLAGTLVWPQGEGPFNTVVLVSGSGAQNRNGELFNHRPFLVLADALARANIAVLRYDDRGFGESTGDFAAATTADFAADARGAVRFLRSQTDVAVGAVGIVGHSEGGLIAPLAADDNADVDFLVLLAAPGVYGKTLLVAQAQAVVAADGASEGELDAIEARLTTLYGCYELDDDSLELLDACLRGGLSSSNLSDAELEAQLATLEAPWFRYFVTYDPAPVLERTRIPVLALNGGLDVQVPAALNLPAIESALAEAENEQATILELPDLNHLFQHATTGSVTEYATIDETMAPEVLDTIAEWIGGIEPPER